MYDKLYSSYSHISKRNKLYVASFAITFCISQLILPVPNINVYQV